MIHSFYFWLLDLLNWIFDLIYYALIFLSSFYIYIQKNPLILLHLFCIVSI